MSMFIVYRSSLSGGLMTRPDLEVLTSDEVIFCGLTSKGLVGELSTHFKGVSLIVLSGMTTRCRRLRRIELPASVSTM